MSRLAFLFSSTLAASSLFSMAHQCSAVRPGGFLVRFGGFWRGLWKVFRVFWGVLGGFRGFYRRFLGGFRGF